MSIFSIAACFSLNVFAGGGGWNSDLVDPQQCVKLSGAQYTYNSSSNKCMQGINEGKSMVFHYLEHSIMAMAAKDF